MHSVSWPVAARVPEIHERLYDFNEKNSPLVLKTFHFASLLLL